MVPPRRHGGLFVLLARRVSDRAHLVSRGVRHVRQILNPLRVGHVGHFLDGREVFADDRRLQQCYERVGNTYSLIHPEAEQKRKDGDRPDRVEGLIESRIQNRIRSRSYDFDR